MALEVNEMTKDKNKTGMTVPRKPLSISSNKLSISDNNIISATKDRSESHSTHFQKKSSVIIITKAKGATHHSVKREDDALSREEQTKRLILLKKAESEKSKYTNLSVVTKPKSENQEQDIKIETPSAVIEDIETKEIAIKQDASNVLKDDENSIKDTDTNRSTEQNDSDAQLESVSDTVIKSKAQHKKEAPNIKHTSMMDLERNKVRNFNSIAPSQSLERDKSSKISDVNTSKVASTTEDKSKKSLVTTKKKKDDISEEVVLTKKKPSDLNAKKFERLGNKGALAHFAITKVLNDDDDDISVRRSGTSIRKTKNKRDKNIRTQEKVFRRVSIPDTLSVQDLANRMTEKVKDVIKVLSKIGIDADREKIIDADTAELVISEFGHTPIKDTELEFEQKFLDLSQDTPDKMKPRAPVVTIMGHVDHGKTSLLDALRATDVAAREAGGITQHIGAYSITLANDQHITFLDTPGHEAFTAMRMRGARVTDIVVLVVAADDGIKEQTIEAINHAKAAGVPIIVAVNKIDKPEANLDKVKRELLRYDLVPEEMGGDIMLIPVSAKNKLGLDKLEEAILLQAEISELKANYNAHASGAVIETSLDKFRGPVATLLVQRGTLKIGDIVVAGTCYGKVKAIKDDKGKSIDKSLPAYPVEILGLNQAPEAGDTFIVVANESSAKELTSFRMHKEKQLKAAASKKASIEKFLKPRQDGKCKELAVIVKADVAGSAEALINAINKFSNDEVVIKVLHSGVGIITESDINLASASSAIIIAFHIKIDNRTRELASKHKVTIEEGSIIYNVIESVKRIASGLLAPTITEKYLGTAQVREMFNLTNVGLVAGCMVSDGVIERSASVRVIRNGSKIYEGKLKTLRRFKDDVKEVTKGSECGISIDRYDNLQAGDVLEVFNLIEQARTLD